MPHPSEPFEIESCDLLTASYYLSRDDASPIPYTPRMTARARSSTSPVVPGVRATDRGPTVAGDPGDPTVAAARAATIAVAASSPGEPSGSPGLAAALDRVGDRWSLLLVEALLDGPRRFGELEVAVPGIAPNILADRLRRLERAGIVRSTPYSTRPPRLAYALSADGAELAGALRLLADWGARSADRPEALRHETCGTPLEARWYCPTCARAVDDVEPEGSILL